MFVLSKFSVKFQQKKNTLYPFNNQIRSVLSLFLCTIAQVFNVLLVKLDEVGPVDDRPSNN